MASTNPPLLTNVTTNFVGTRPESRQNDQKLFKDTEIGSILLVFGPVVLTLLIGGVYLAKRSRKHEDRNKSIDDIIGRGEELRKLSIEYWSTSVTKTTATTARTLEQEIKSLIKAINSDARTFSERHDKRAKEVLATCIDEVDEACTGGEFETAKRTPDKSRCEMVSREVSRLNAELLKFKT